MSNSLVVLLGLAVCFAQPQSDDESDDHIRITHTCTDQFNVAAQCLVVGNPNVQYDKVLIDEKYEKIAIPFFTRTDDLVLPVGGWTSNEEITFVQVGNLGNYGTVTMTRGGPGYRTVSLHLEAPRGKGYKFELFVKGRPSPGSNFHPVDIDDDDNSTPTPATVSDSNNSTNL